MDFGALLLLTFAQGALTVETETPASTCPDPSALNALIAERVSDTAQSTYTLRHALVTDAQSGQSYVRARLYDATEVILLERLIPVEHGDCSAVPLAITVILENYFAGPAPNGEEPTPAETSATAGQTASRGDHGAPTAAARRVRKPRFRILGGFNLLAGPAAGLELGVNYFFSTNAFVHAHMRAQLHPAAASEQGISFVHSSQGVYLGSGLYIPLVTWAALTFSPEIGLHYQRIEVRDDQVLDTSTRNRLVPSLGGRLDLNLCLTNRLWLGAGGRLSDWLGGSRFTVEQIQAPDLEVLGLPTLDWDAHLFIVYWL